MEHIFGSIDGWFAFENIYREVAELLEDGDHIVEIGAWKGKSASFMAVEIINRGVKVQFDVIDTFLGSPEHMVGQKFEDADAVNGTLYDRFLENMKPVEGYYTPIKMASLDAVSHYADNSLDFVLIDATHEYEPVKADILAWLPKVKPGAILAGDDYRGEWPGVINAVNECLPGVQIKDCAWWYIKPT
jgi:hypothetical protein